MTPEDEPFIRAIVDQPGDDTPRLVYADWLEDRDDPRGRFLRAEVGAMRAGTSKTAKLLKFAADGLDPVWVARVGRPPFGVCTDQICAAECSEPLLSPADITTYESQHGIKLNPQHHALLLNWNGGAFKLIACNVWSYSLNQGICVIVGGFSSLSCLELAEGVSGYHRPFVVVHRGSNGSTVFVGTDGDGRVIYHRDGYNFGATGLLAVADSLGQFLHMLTTPSPSGTK